MPFRCACIWALALLFVAGCTNGPEEVEGSPPGTPIAATGKRAIDPSMKPVVHARSMPVPHHDDGPVFFLPPGSRVGRPSVGPVAADGMIRYGLANDGPMMSVAFPVISTEGGPWVINGPRFWYAAAQGGSGVGYVEVVPPTTAVYWGANAIRMTSDRGRHWYYAWFDAGVEDLQVRGRSIRARVFGPQEASGRWTQTYLYVSPDHGHTWELKRRMADV